MEERLWSARELAEVQLPDPTFLVEPWIPLGGIALLHGKRGVGKSQFILTLANAITHGHDFLGRYPTTKGPVVIIQADMPLSLQQLRVRRALQSLEADSTYFFVPRTLNIATMSINHMDIVEQIREIDPVLIVWDTLRSIHHMAEDVSETPQKIYTIMKDLFGRATHLPAHHERKDPADPRLQPDPEEAFRGSTDWIDSADASFQLTTAKKRFGPRRVVWTPHKARAVPEDEKNPVPLEMDPDTLLLQPLREAEGVVEEDARSVRLRGQGAHRQARRLEMVEPF